MRTSSPFSDPSPPETDDEDGKRIIGSLAFISFQFLELPPEEPEELEEEEEVVEEGDDFSEPPPDDEFSERKVIFMK